MKLYQIDYKKLVLLLLPTFLRKPRLFAFLTSFTFSVSELHIQFLKNRDINLLRLRRNGQVCYLRGMLNDELDPGSRRIRITDGESTGDWIFAFGEQEPYQLLVSDPGTMLYGEALIIANTAFFNVSVPWTPNQTNLNNRLRNFLNEYKLLSKKYIINHEQTKL